MKNIDVLINNAGFFLSELFDSNVLPMMIDILKEKYDAPLYCRKAVRDLMRYDMENGTELLETLKICLNHNLSIPKTTESLFIASSTCLYRIQRIESILHMSLSEPQNNLYLKLLFVLL